MGGTLTTTGSEAAGNAYQLRTRSSSLRTAWVDMDGEEEEKAAAMAAALSSSDSEGEQEVTGGCHSLLKIAANFWAMFAAPAS